MPATLSLKIITPERIVLEKDVDKLIATAIDGELEILPGHEPLVTALAIDVLRFSSGGTEDVAAIMGGVMEVSGKESTEVTVLSDVAELDEEIDQTRAKQARDRAEAEKMQKTDKMDVYVSEMAISRAVARIKAIELRQRRTGSHRTPPTS
jgi:F-type H+-transporting ATPase subunit epsilon